MFRILRVKANIFNAEQLGPYLLNQAKNNNTVEVNSVFLLLLIDWINDYMALFIVFYVIHISLDSIRNSPAHIL